MIRIENTEVVGWEHAVRGMRNPLNSWDKSDSDFFFNPDILGENDLALARTLANAGTDHGKFLRMIVVYADWTAPLFLWKEIDQYKVGTVTDSCSTMHKIHSKEFTLDDFSCENLKSIYSLPALENTIYALNYYREEYLKTRSKEDWRQMIELLPSSYNQRRTIMLNYAVLRNMYHARKNHKLDEWRDICKWIESLSYSELITDVEGKAV